LRARSSVIPDAAPSAAIRSACSFSLRCATIAWAARGARLEPGACGRRRAHQKGIVDASDAGVLEFGKERAARVRRDRRNRAGPRPNPEAMERERSLAPRVICQFGFLRHGSSVVW
jgi:hypothetical protein